MAEQDGNNPKGTGVVTNSFADKLAARQATEKQKALQVGWAEVLSNGTDGQDVAPPPASAALEEAMRASIDATKAGRDAMGPQQQVRARAEIMGRARLEPVPNSDVQGSSASSNGRTDGQDPDLPPK